MFFKNRKSYEQKQVLKMLTGRQISHITRRGVDENGSFGESIVAKQGRIAVVDDKISIISGTDDVFLCPVKQAKCNLLMSGNGVSVEGDNSVIGKYDKLIVYFAKFN